MKVYKKMAISSTANYVMGAFMGVISIIAVTGGWGGIYFISLSITCHRQINYILLKRVHNYISFSYIY